MVLFWVCLGCFVLVCLFGFLLFVYVVVVVFVGFCRVFDLWLVVFAGVLVVLWWGFVVELVEQCGDFVEDGVGGVFEGYCVEWVVFECR